jgi:hypothetical protein
MLHSLLLLEGSNGGTAAVSRAHLLKLVPALGRFAGQLIISPDDTGRIG